MPLDDDDRRAMIRYLRTKPNHLVYIHEQLAQSDDKALMLSPGAVSLFEYSIALSGFVGSKCLGCAGLIEAEDCVMLWALMSHEAGPYLLEITRKVNRVLSGVRAKRIIACVKPGFEQGRRWIELLGFKLAEPGVHIKGYPKDVVMDVYEKGEA